MGRRTLTALPLLILILPAIYFGGILFFLYLGVFVVTAAWEYVQLFRAVAYRPSLPVTALGVVVILTTRAFRPEEAEAALMLLILGAMTFHLIAYERGRDQAAVDFAITVGGVVYLGWIAAYILDLRAMEHGGWWVMLVFPVVWLADTAAYLIGVRYGAHKMFLRLSPNKSWEGYFAGVVTGTIVGGLFGFAFSMYGPLSLGWWQGFSLGFMISATCILGDLGESMFKRLAKAKDSGNLLPGHGGAFDRIDSLIWAAVAGYFWIRYLML